MLISVNKEKKTQAKPKEIKTGNCRKLKLERKVEKNNHSSYSKER